MVESRPTDGGIQRRWLRVKKAGEAERAPRRVLSLGQDLQQAAVGRLVLVALLVVAFTVVLRVALPQSPGTTPVILDLRLFSFVSTVALSLGVAVLAWRRALPVAALLNLALFYEVVQAFLFAVTYHAVSADSNPAPRGWSTVAVWVLAFPLVIPATRVRTWVATLLAALMDPLGLAVAAWAGSPVPSRTGALSIFLRTGFAVVAALLVSRILYQMGKDVADARAMGAYRLVERIGQGGMGEVWRAEHRTLARPAAIKLIRPEALASNGWNLKEATARFEHEARATAALRSAHTVAVYDFGAAEDGSLYYVMELLDGYDSDTLVRRFGPLPPERVVYLLRQVCHSLEEAHRAGLVHRDIKPANILICRQGLDLDFAKVVDFGLVKHFRGSTHGDGQLTSGRHVAGTPEYMSPEMALGKNDVDRRSDIYSLGCVAYWMLTGKPVFEAKSPLEVALNHVETSPVPPSKRTERVIPGDFEQIVLDCLSKDPRQRPQTATGLADRLADLGLEGSWTRRRIRSWWRDHAPERPRAG
jgi:serine/threonine-protein kinase